MITQNNQKKVEKFYKVVLELQSAGPKDIGLLIINKETLADIAALAPNSNQTTIFDLKKDIDPEQIIKNLSDAVSHDRLILIRIYNYLNPKIYNQIYLLSKNGRMDFIEQNKDMVIQATEKSAIILVSTEKDLKTNNYQNILDLAGFVERL